jgi:hypothetical protein
MDAAPHTDALRRGGTTREADVTRETTKNWKIELLKTLMHAHPTQIALPNHNAQTTGNGQTTGNAQDNSNRKTLKKPNEGEIPSQVAWMTMD